MTLTDIWSLPLLDVDAAVAGAEEYVAGVLPAPTATAEHRARAAADLLETLNTDATRARALRDAAAVTVMTTYRVRRGANMPGALGVVRARWKAIRDEQARVQPADVPDALEHLGEYAAAAAQANARIAAATTARHKAIADLIAEGRTNVEIAKAARLDPSRISTMRNHPTAA